MSERPSCMSGRGREALPNFREALPYVQEWSGVPLGCPGVVGRPSLMSVRPSRMSRSVWEALPYIR